jgi:hypothetical protein
VELLLAFASDAASRFLEPQSIEAAIRRKFLAWVFIAAGTSQDSYVVHR